MDLIEERVLSKELVVDILKDVIAKENIIDPTYYVSSGASKGDGYLSFVTRVDVKGKNKDLNLIIKHAPRNEKLRELMPITDIYRSEITFYSIVAPVLDEFQKEKGVKNPFNSLAKCYKTLSDDSNELLVLENLKVQGFNVHEKSKPMSSSQVKLVLKEYGRFHAVSFAMKKYARDKFDYIDTNIEEPFTKEHFEQFNDMYVSGLEKVISLFDKSSDAGIYNCLVELKENFMDFFISTIGLRRNYDVVIHGDCWCNNMMFKYEVNSSIPSELRFFDFQLSKIASPAFDLAYFFYVSASQEMLDNLDTYLKVYHDSLREHLKAMDCDADELFPFSALKEEWTFFAKWGFLVSLVLMRIMFRDDSEVVDLTDNEDLTDTFMQDSKNDDIINKRYKMLALHHYQHGFI